MIVRLWLALLVAKLSTVVTSKQHLHSMAEELCNPRYIQNTSIPVTLIPFDKVFLGMVNKSNTLFYILIHQKTELGLSVTTMPCKSTLKWNLKFIPLTKYNRSMAILNRNNDNILSELGKKPLIEYTGITASITYNHGEHGKTYKGLYIITAQTVDDNSLVVFHVTLKPITLPTNNFFFRPNGIKIKKGGHKISLRWNLSHIDHHFITYCLVVSTSKIYSDLHDAESNLKERQKRNLTSNSSLSIGDDRLEIHYLEFSTNYTLTNLIYDKTYYFTVFALNGTRSVVHHANTTYTFQKPKPIALKDARPKKIDLRALSGKASFRYKVGNKPIDDSYLNTLYWYVMPCNGVVNVEIRCRKSILVKKRVFGYEKLVLNNTKRGERYVLKVETASVDETQLVKTVEVMATVRETKFPMPDLPEDLRVRPYVQTDDCNSVKIGWLVPNKTNTDLRYCVSVQNYRENNVDFSTKPDQCELSYGNNRIHDIINRRRTRCYIGAKEDVEVRKILKLRSSTTYTVQVTVTKPRGRTLSYDLLKLDTNSCGLE